MKEISLSQLVADSKNANKGNQKGAKKLKKSIEKLGIGRGVLVDKDNNIIAGNHVVAEAIAQGFERAIVVPTDGKTLVVTKRTDVDIDSSIGRELALADNITAKEGIEFDEIQVQSILADFDIDVDFVPDFDVDIESDEYEGEYADNIDYSSKNKEISPDEFSDTKMYIRLEYVEDEYNFVKEQLSKIAPTPEQAVWKLLKNE